MRSFRKHFTEGFHEDPPNPGSRFYVGLSILILSFFMLAIGIFIREHVESPFWRNFILAAFWVSAPLMKITSVAILGKPSYIWIKAKFFRIFARYVKPYHNSRMRYNIGLFLFCLPFVPNYFMAYAPRIFEHDFTFRIIMNISTDVIFITSLFVLGGDFWDKLKALFVFSAKVKFPEDEEEERQKEAASNEN